MLSVVYLDDLKFFPLIFLYFLDYYKYVFYNRVVGRLAVRKEEGIS